MAPPNRLFASGSSVKLMDLVGSDGRYERGVLKVDDHGVSR